MSAVVTLDVPPKQRTQTYKQIPITVTFQVPTRTWHWQFPMKIEHIVSGEAHDMNVAFTKAKRRIDELGLGK